MMYKVLCVVLIAAVLVEANLTLYDQNGNLTPFGQRFTEARKTFNDWFSNVIVTNRRVINKFGESVRETVAEDAQVVRNGIDSTVDAGKEVFNAAGKVIEAKIALVTSAPKILANTYNKVTQQ